jgi:Co/Zn/Cd efflux system component
LGAAFLLRSARAERYAGFAVLLAILVSAGVALYEAVERLIHPQAPDRLVALALAGVLGFVGNEAAAVIRVRAGRRLDSPALVADGYHARTDGIVSLGVVASAAFVALGAEVADPVVGLALRSSSFASPGSRGGRFKPPNCPPPTSASATCVAPFVAARTRCGASDFRCR